MMFRLPILLCLFSMLCSAQVASKAEAGKEFSDKYSVSSINLNSSYSEFSPFLMSNKFFFVSNKGDGLGVTYTNSKNQNTCDIFSCNLLDSVTFSKPKSIAEINSAYDDGPVVVNNAGNYMLFSSSTKKGNLQLYFSVLENGKWSKPLLHPVSRAGNSYFHPSLSPDEKTIFFCSDKPGGYGGVDIYYSRYENLNWSNPVNLGPKINSVTNELFPYFSADNQFYFSSKRDQGKGNLDIYSFNLKDSLTTIAQLLDFPINSAFDDFGICMDASGNGYFSSNRNTKEGDNIFYFSKTIPEFKRCTPLKKSSCYSFYKETYSAEDETKETQYEWDFGDGNKAKAKAVKHCFSSPGFYTVKLNLIEKASGKIVYNELAYTIAVKPQGLHIDVKDTLFTNTDISLDASASLLDGYAIQGYYWTFNDTSFFKGPRATHRYFENGIYLIELGISAQNLLTKQVENFCIDKYILVGDAAYIEKNLRYFKYAQLLPDADSIYFESDEEVALTLQKNKKSFRYTKLTEDAFTLTGNEEDDVLLSEKERSLRTHKFGLLGSDSSSLSGLDNSDAALSEIARKLRTHKYRELGADKNELDNLSDVDAILRAQQRLMRFKNASLPPVVDTLYFPKTTDETFYKVNLGSSDSRLDKHSGVFEGIKKLEEIKEGNRYRYTSGNEKEFSAIVPYYEDAKQKGFKDASVVGFVNEAIDRGQAKNLHAVIFDSALVENHALKIYFKYDVETYDSKYTSQIDSLVKKSKNPATQKVLLITHFDGLGNIDYNTMLNTQRTNNMIRYLEKRGVKKNNIKTEFIIHPTEKLAPDLLRRIEVFLMN